jgi:predicted MFS family arabinose efflux permease
LSNMPRTEMETRRNPSPVWASIFSGLCASLIGIGLARFAYTPLLPVLIQEHWFSASAVVYLGAANLVGYLIGAMLGRPFAARVGNVSALRAMKVLVTLAFLACAFPFSTSWFFVWRLLSGIAGGVIMVLVAATILPHIPAHRQGLATGAVFFGLGCGIAASGTLLPLLLRFGLSDTWIGLAALSAMLTAASWRGWPTGPGPVTAAHRSSPEVCAAAVRLLYAQYALMAASLVPAMIFLVDFIARGLHGGAALGSRFWVLYGAGAMIGPPLYGFFADRFGARSALRAILLVQAMALVCLAMTSDYAVIAVLAIVIGSFPPGIIPPILARVKELAPAHATRRNQIWSRATTLFAASQALSAYASSAIFNRFNGDYRLLFWMGATATGLALIVELYPNKYTNSS